MWKYENVGNVKIWEFGNLKIVDKVQPYVTGYRVQVTGGSRNNNPDAAHD